MSILTFVFYIGILNIIFNFLWKWIVVLPMAVILSSIKIEKYGMRVVKLFGVYLFVSMLAIFTLVLYPIISVFVVVIGLASSFHELRKEAMQTQDWELLLLARREETFQGFLILIGVVLYI